MGSSLFTQQSRQLIARCHLSLFSLTFISQQVQITAHNACYNRSTARASFRCYPLHSHATEASSDTTTGAEQGSAPTTSRLNNCDSELQPVAEQSISPCVLMFGTLSRQDPALGCFPIQSDNRDLSGLHAFWSGSSAMTSVLHTRAAVVDLKLFSQQPLSTSSLHGACWQDL